MTAITYVRYEPAGALAECLHLDPAAELAARRLRDWTWANRGAPAARPELLCTIARCSARRWRKVDAQLRRIGWRVRRDRYECPEALRVLREAQAARRRYARAGRIAAEVRWADADALTGASQPHNNRNADELASGMPINVKDINSNLNVIHPMRSYCASAPKGEGPEPGKRPEKTLPKELQEEKEFLAQVGQLYDAWKPGSSQRQLVQWGGWWRLRFREDPEKCRAIIADVASMHRERRLKGPPGPACYDLWHRLPGTAKKLASNSHDGSDPDS